MASATALVALQPVSAALIAAVFLAQRPTTLAIPAAALRIAGLATVISDSSLAAQERPAWEAS